MSQQRNLKAQIRKILSEHHLLSAAEIKQYLNQQGTEFNKTSIYRSLEQLVGLGEVCKNYFQENQALYETRQDEHLHLVCQKCQQVFVKDQPQILELKSYPDFKVDHAHLTIIGTCDQCLPNT